jgi:hypothetical protein
MGDDGVTVIKYTVTRTPAPELLSPELLSLELGTGDWNEFVNTPMTPTEMAKARKLIIRQKSNKKPDYRTVAP